GGELFVVVGSIPGARPLPDIPGHVVKAVAVGSELLNGRDANVAILARIPVREVSLKGVGHPAAGRHELVAPRVEFAAQPTSSGELPLRLGRQTFARPPRKRDGVVVRDLHDRVPFPARQAALGAFGMAPVCTLHVRPPLELIVEPYRMTGR